ncbi:hypothetical protein BV25DRAFT_1920462 [Artomyces pyxidatus]|uniref:Uncharacterized protein n=1 Tax=Artomyces pyxidatus TaxID=48021 RepID=A0ACB8SKW5_9AGAM|nr:hypothetical protein BV25DRAFT_1920462 [Artomyces pyxidatus]
MHVTAPFAADGRYAALPLSYHRILRLAFKYDAEDGPILEAEKRIAAASKDAQPSIRVPQHPNPARVIRLATDCNIPDVLPIAYYDLCRALDSIAPSLSPIKRVAELSQFTVEEVRRVTYGKSITEDFVRRRILNVRRTPMASISLKQTDHNRHMCRMALGDWWAWKMGDKFSTLDTLRWLEGLIQDCTTAKEICGGCRGWTVNRVSALPTAFWQHLPRAFGLTTQVPSDWGHDA